MQLSDFERWIIIAYFAEQYVFSAVIIAISIAMMVIYRKAIQQISVKTDAEKLGVSTSITFAMPVFILLVLVGYAYVVFEARIDTEMAQGERRLGFRGAASLQDLSSIDRLTDAQLRSLSIASTTLESDILDSVSVARQDELETAARHLEQVRNAILRERFDLRELVSAGEEIDETMLSPNELERRNQLRFLLGFEIDGRFDR